MDQEHIRGRLMEVDPGGKDKAFKACAPFSETRPQKREGELFYAEYDHSDTATQQLCLWGNAEGQCWHHTSVDENKF